MGIRNMDSAAPAGFEGHPRVLLAISAEPAGALRGALAAGREPGRDSFALQDALAADLWTPAAAAATPMGRLLSRFGGRAAALAWAAFVRRHAYDAIYTDAENVGLPLALLLRYSRARAGRPRHVMLTHYLSPAKKRVFFRLGAGTRIDALIVHSAAQGELAWRTLGMPATRMLYLPYFADERFWRALPGGEAPPPRPMICAGGVEVRDYGTHLPTGFYVCPGDARDLRRAIQYLLDHPDVAEELGRNGRRVVEALFGLDAFTARFAAAIRGEQAPLVAPGEALPASSDAKMRTR